MHLHRKTIHLLLGKNHQMLNHKGCWTCLWEGDWKQMSVTAGDKGPRRHRANPSAFTAWRSTGCHQAADWKAALHGSWCSQIHLLQIQKYGSRSFSRSRIDDSPCGWARILNCAFLYITWYSPANQPINQPTNQIPKQQKMCLYHKTLCDYPLRLKDVIILWLGMLITHLWRLTGETYLINLQFYFWSPVLLAWRKNGERAVLTRN